MAGLLDKLIGKAPKGSASAAKERLQIVIASSKRNSNPDFIEQLKQEILEVLSKHVNITESDVECDLQRDTDGHEILELNVALPEGDIEITAR